MILSQAQLNNLLGKRIVFDTCCELGKQRITGDLLGYAIYYDEPTQIIVRCDAFGDEYFESSDIQRLRQIVN
ncbi:hypothetical protein B0181_11460 [Moraxella caviae]|uniref:Uncharacterized protein n=1 Tax=Moraxella caviae TaxID=34060 RepID=A0A1S9ZTG1_9GAMM|nr:hypothetical protein [Moraxella caviae]OOR86794.1 hypothetical protein B0181_11460 [Moraxella caviae]STZ13567.1 Uncharacterised protein [Moraxella caviae]STZ13571.1 Uncharacterised protein [Moraxella caviae]STZ14611.1 Uncharacterised protein [Moraxella caviae]STZ14615.1 Uncharacterised protein [Moraxella caviae]